MSGPLALSNEYSKLLGIFHYNWSAIDIHVDYAIYQFLKVTPLQAHLITSGMMFGRKARLLVDLIKHSGNPKRGELLEAFGQIQKANRDMIAHSWTRSDSRSVTFLERKISGPFSAKEHSFTLPEFEKLVDEIRSAGKKFRELLGVKSEDLDEFANVALKVSRKGDSKN
jgi:hypothetical protein